MHSGIILLAVCSVALIVLMVTCFVCFIRSRRKEDEEFMQQVQFTTRQQQHEYATQMANQNQLEPVQQQQQATSPSSLQMVEQNGELLDGDGQKQSSQASYAQVISQQQQQLGGRQSPYSAAAAAYAVAAASSPYHNQQAQVRQQETRSDITQQINSAIIGSSEAEFQNDFIQVFPMYQIAPQPEKNTTPYLT